MTEERGWWVGGIMWLCKVMLNVYFFCDVQNYLGWYGRDQITPVINSTPWCDVFYAPSNWGSILQGLLSIVQKCDILETSRGPPHPSPSTWQSLSSPGDPLSSSFHFYWQQLPGISWADNGDSSKKLLVKTYGVSGVHPGLLPHHKAVATLNQYRSVFLEGSSAIFKGK